MIPEDVSTLPASQNAALQWLQRVSVWVFDHWIALAAGSWLVSGLLYLTLPPSADQFMHAYTGWRLLEGDIPYRDFFDPNWPGVTGLHALAIALFGVNLWSWHAFDFLLFAICALALADVARLAAGRNAAKLSLMLLPLIYAGAGYWLAGQHDMTASQFLACALWFHVRACQRRAIGWQLATGLFIGAAMLNKPTVGILIPLLLLQILWLETPARAVIKHAVAMATGLLAAVLAAAGAVLLTGASAQDLIDNVFTFNAYTQFMDTPVYQRRDRIVVTWMVFREHVRWNWVLVLGSLPALFWIFRAGNRSIASTALPMLWLCGVVSCLVQSRGWPYHLSPSIVALAAMLPVSLAVVADVRVRFGRDTLGASVTIVFVALIAVGLGNRLVYLYGPVPKALASGQFDQQLSRFTANDGLNLAESLGFVRRLAARPPNECVLVVGTVSSINYLSQRYQATHFYYFPVLYLTRPPLPMADRWVDLWEADLDKANCHFTLVADWVRTDWLNGTGRAAAALRQHLQAYRETGTLGAKGGMVIYERK